MEREEEGHTDIVLHADGAPSTCALTRAVAVAAT